MDDDEVGYGKPPKQSRFVKGQSGNKKGRPKNVKNLKNELTKVLCERVTIHEGGRSKKVTKVYALMQSLFVKPFKGDSRAAINLLNVIARLVDPNTDLNSEPLNFNYGPTGKVKELTPSEKLDYLRKLVDAFKDVKGLPPKAREMLLGEKAEGVDTTNRDQDTGAAINLSQSKVLR